MSRQRPFRATYRLQLGADLDFAAASQLIPYLAELGVSHLYLSPIWQARAGSTHGYDIVDPRRVSRELGGELGLRRLADAAHAAGLGIVCDVVPNHMATDEANPFWSDPADRERFFDLDLATGRHRRFFDIDELAGVRQEDPHVFATTHELVLALVAEGVIDGLRIDHPDGLADPAAYLRRLAGAGVEHVWVEKILDPGEQLRAWPCEGTTGYEFCVDLTALFVDPDGEAALTELHAELTGEGRAFAEIAAEAKREQALGTFAPEVDRLRRLHDPPGLVEGLVALPVYRTYLEHDLAPETADVEALEMVPELVRDALLEMAPEVPREWLVRFQQTTPPIMAKGVEDTAFYRDVRLLALNEVGGDPGRFSVGVGEFHAANSVRARRFPRNLLVTSTHDTKRMGDVRARIGTLAGMAEPWAAAVRSWIDANGELGQAAGGPTPAEELLIYQTLVGAWPITAGRLSEYLVKAMREAKTSTSWAEPDERHERAVCGWAAALLKHGPFRDRFDGFVSRVIDAGQRAALAQTLLKLTCPGTPDIYQGDELWALFLVDPDNRRPVDWEARRTALSDFRGGAPATHETAKLHLIASTLELRSRRPGAFAGSYTPVAAGAQVCAFLRGSDVLVAVGLRDHSTGSGGWVLPGEAAGRWRDVLGSETEYELPGGATLAGLLGPDGRALLERVH